MLTNLHVQNLAIIDVIDIEFDKGLTAFTGETGAGKSLIIDAISLLTGAKTNSSLVRNGCTKATIEGTFENVSDNVHKVLEELEIDDDDVLVLRRDIYATGKSVFKVNGITVNLVQADLICDHLVDIHVQNDTLRLFEPKNYLSFIDNAVSKEILSNYSLLYQNYQKSLKAYNELLSKKDESTKNFDFLKFQLDELEKAHLIPNELNDLEEELKILNNYENIFQYLQDIKDLIKDNNLRETLYQINDSLKRLKSINPNYISYHTDIDNAYYTLDDLENTVTSDLSSLEFDEDRLNEINERISTLNRLMRKHHMSLDELIAYKDQLAKDLADVDNYDVYLEDSRKEVKKAYELLKSEAIKLSAARKSNAKTLTSSILSTLKDLLLYKVRLEFVFNEVNFTDELNSKIFTNKGIDNIDILISFNPGEALKPLSKIASGGEMSRVMLALKAHLFVNRGLSTVIFDEIDTGMSGLALEGIAKKLKFMSKDMQVFAITHLPIVASSADNQYLVKKDTSGDKTFTSVTKLSYEERVNSLAEMISPNDETGKAKEVAKLLLEKNK